MKKNTMSFEEILDAIYHAFPNAVKGVPIRMNRTEAREIRRLFGTIHNCALFSKSKLPIDIKSSEVSFAGSAVLCPEKETELSSGEELPRTVYFYFLKDNRVRFEKSGHCDAIRLPATARTCETWHEGIIELNKLMKKYGGAKLKEKAGIIKQAA